MSTLAHVPDHITVESCLAGENDGQLRHEYASGHVYARAAACERHNGVKLDITGFLNASLDGQCRVFDGDMKLRIDRGDDIRFCYPDVFVSSAPDSEDPYVRRDAVLVMEVVSPSTERTDRFEKFQAYTRLPMLAECALVEQDVPRLGLHRRRTGWAREVFGPGSTVSFESVSLAMTVEQIHRRIKF